MRFTYKCHDFSNSSLHMKSLVALHSDHVALAGQRREHDVGSIRLKDLPDLVQSTKQDAINLCSWNRHILNVKSKSRSCLVKLLLGHLDGLVRLSSDEDIGRVSATRIRWAVAIHLREWWREVDCSSRRRLDELNILPVTTTNKLVAGQFEASSINNTAELELS